MNTPLGIAFKEWAVICRALSDARQAVILRKGGIAEAGGSFRPEHERFWLYPTYFHEHREGIRPDFSSLFDAAEAARPPAGIVRLSHFAEVQDVIELTELQEALSIMHTHIWTQDIVKQRFQYRKPGLFVLTVRVYAVPVPFEIVDRPEYAGCKSWVPLEQALSTEGARAVARTLGD